ncbi:MAG TPA: periplasmic heavy metal sensor [bacterium]|nr:periplasmic heavy metal sensor [bacterium]
MKSKTLTIVLVVLIIINLSAFATISYKRYCAYHDKCALKENHTAKGQMICEALSLNKNQVEKMRGLSSAFHTKSDSISAQLNQKRFQLIELISSPTVDDQQLDQLLAEISSLQTKLQRHVLDYLMKEKATLSLEQQDKYFKMIRTRLIKQAQSRQNSNINFLEDSCNTQCEEQNNNCPINSK